MVLSNLNSTKNKLNTKASLYIGWNSQQMVEMRELKKKIGGRCFYFNKPDCL